MGSKGKIGIVIESSFNPVEFEEYNKYFPSKGYDVEYLSYLWNQPSATYLAAPKWENGDPKQELAKVEVKTDVEKIKNFDDYKGIVLMGGACADRLRYEANVKEGAFNHAPAVDFVRRAAMAADQGKIKLGVICHGMWLLVAAPELLYNRRITTAHNIISDVRASGGRLVYDTATDELPPHIIDGNLITARQGSPDVVKNFVKVFVEELEKGCPSPIARTPDMYLSDAQRFIQRSFALLSGKNSIEDVLTLFPSTEDGKSFFVEIPGRDQMKTHEELKIWYEHLDKTIYYIKQLSFIETSESFCTASLNMIKKRVTKPEEEIWTTIYVRIEDVKGNKIVITQLKEEFVNSKKNSMQSTSLMGTVKQVVGDTFFIECRSGDIFLVKTNGSTTYNALTNLGEQGIDRDRYGNFDKFDPENPASKLRKYLKIGVLVSVKGTFYMDTMQGSSYLDARVIHLLYKLDGLVLEKTALSDLRYCWESPRWWQQQVRAMADTWLAALWPGKDEYDFNGYLSNLDITLKPTNDRTQECATLSRLIYGLSSSYLLTGIDRYFDAAKAGVEFQRKHYKLRSDNGGFLLWAFGRRDKQLIFTSQNEDDKNTIPLYEQIYDLAGLAQFYRITQEWEVIDDIRLTVASFNKFYKDEGENKPNFGGYFSHLDYVSGLCTSDTLGPNKSKKNWNSIGDHIPAYLVNLILALESAKNEACGHSLDEMLITAKTMLDETSQLIIDNFFNEMKDGIPYVQERFLDNWVPDKSYKWQQNRAIIGHNLKIAWNFIRVASYYQKTNPEKAKKLVELAEMLGKKMLEVGAIDLFSGGCYDAVEREKYEGQPPTFAWANTKDFWQQEQGILAYYVLYGYTKNPDFLQAAREMSAFWNIYFLDRDHTGIHFRTTDIGDPVIEGSYGAKAGHAIAGYHMFELNYLAHIYISTYVTMEEFSLFFRPSNKDTKRFVVWPDFLVPGSVTVKSVSVNGSELVEGVGFSAHDGWVELKNDAADIGSTVRVIFKPTGKSPYTRRPVPFSHESQFLIHPEIPIETATTN